MLSKGTPLMKSERPSILCPATGMFSLAVVLVVLASPVLALVGATAEAAGATDTVFLVDSSGSNFRSDPQGARKLLIDAVASLIRERPGERIAVAQFAGWIGPALAWPITS